MRVIAVALMMHVAAAQVHAEPAEHWKGPDPASAWPSASVSALAEYGRSHKPTAVMIVQQGNVVASYGDLGRKVNMRSVRKSILSALYGMAVAEGKINLSASLADLDINDKSPDLTAAEKQATLRDLLMAHSGVYHAAAYESRDMKEKRPERGSHAPGSYWYYNNWDFNALGTIYRRVIGEDIFRSFEQRIARPLGMEDFSVRDCEYVSEPASQHPAYVFRLSARDAARFGLLFLNDGQWRGQQIIPAAWISESTTAMSSTDRRRVPGYGYLWWILPSEEWGPGAFLASGHGGQLIVVVSSRRLVAVQTVELGEKSQGVRTGPFLDLLRKAAM
jgi:CubicO group peptidase (beta-lactamase class C family)